MIDRENVARRPIGATQWSMVKDQEYDDQGENQGGIEHDSLAKILLERMGLAGKKPVRPPDDDDEGNDGGAL